MREKEYKFRQAIAP